MVSHVDAIVPELLFAKSGRNFHQDTAIEISKIYFGSALSSFLSVSRRSTEIEKNLFTARVSHVSGGIPFVPEN